MDETYAKDYIFNFKLAKLVGLYQILDPNFARVFGYNVYHVVVTTLTLFLFIVSMLLPIGVYFWRKNTVAVILFIGIMENVLFGCFKVINIIRHSKHIWKYLDITGVNFLTYRQYNMDIFNVWRKRSIRTTYIYVLMTFFALLMWVLTPLVFNKTIVTIKNIDGSSSNFRMNIFNLYLMVSDETYNNHFNMFFVVEFLLFWGYFYCTLIFDLLMVMMCFALSCQLETICDGIASLGHEFLGDKYSSINNMSKNNLEIFDELRMIIKDHQHVIKKLQDYYTSTKFVMLSQILVASSSQVLVWIIVAMSYSRGEVGGSILLLKLLTVLPIYCFELYMTCVLFGSINEKKDSIIFALYSSNWTSMDIRSKKLILFTMRMNNANNLKLKFTNTRIINLEMFTRTMQTCYTVFSMLINYNKIKNTLQ